MRSGSATNTVGILVADHFVASGQSHLLGYLSEHCQISAAEGLLCHAGDDFREGRAGGQYSSLCKREEKVDIIFVLGWLGRTWSARP